MPKEMKIAITGTIGSGKTEVSNIIREQGFYVFDCDKYNSELLKEDSKAYSQIIKNFPEAYIGNKLDKTVLSNIVFNNNERKKQLENILHPLIVEEMLSQSNKNDPFFAEVPLLFENGLEKLFDISVLVTCDKQIAIKRLINRGLSENDAKRRLNSQIDNEIKIKMASEIIYNNDTLPVLETKVKELINKYVR